VNKWELINAMEAAVHALKIRSLAVDRSSEYDDAIQPFQVTELMRVEHTLHPIGWQIR
jgi:hypothetical protein